MSDNNLTIEQRKDKAKAELIDLEKKLEKSAKELKGKFGLGSHPQKLVSKRPFLVLGVALLAGFVLAGKGKKRKSKLTDAESESPVNISYGPGMRDMLMMQVKRMIAEKGFNYAMDIVDNVVKKKMKEQEQPES